MMTSLGEQKPEKSMRESYRLGNSLFLHQGAWPGYKDVFSL